MSCLQFPPDWQVFVFNPYHLKREENQSMSGMDDIGEQSWILIAQRFFVQALWLRG